MCSIKKPVILIGILVLIFSYADIQARNNYDYLYKNLPFTMPKVEAPVFNKNTVSVSDYGGLGNGYTF
jgi:hypothetical protein